MRRVGDGGRGVAGSERTGMSVLRGGWEGLVEELEDVGDSGLDDGEVFDVGVFAPGGGEVGGGE